MPDNRYYYFKDAKGNRHTVNKAAFDNDREGFAKAFPGARMEVIDRKTGRRGDVDVKDAGRVGDFGAHLFTGQTVGREKYQPKTSLGKAAQRVAQKKWGKEESGAEPSYVGAKPRYASLSLSEPLVEGGKESALVKGLRESDALKRRDEEQMPIDYTKPDAMKQMVGRTRREQQTLDRRIEQAGREAGKDVQGEIRRRNAPAFDLGNEDVNNNLVKTRGQLEKEMEKSGSKFVDDEFSKYIGDVFKKEDEAAFERGQNAALNVIASSPSNAVFGTTRARNEEMSPEKRLANITKEIEGNIHNLFSSPKIADRINAEATKLGISPDDYVEHTLVPSLMNKVSSDFDKTELKNLLPSGAIETILMHAQNSMTGALASMGLMTKSQRQYGQRALSKTLEGNNPNYKPGMGTKVAGSTFSFMMDMAPIGMAEKPAAAVAGKLFGNGVAQTARIANSTLGGRIARMAGSGMVSQGVTGVLYGSTNAAVQNYSTGDDTSIGNTVKLMAMGGLSEGASWATMGGIGGAVGAGIYNVSGVKRIPAKAFQLAMEGIGMHMGGNVAKTIEGHDTDWLSVEGNLEACANVVALKLTHARLPKRQEKDGVKESYLDVVARNIKSLMTSDGQRAAFGGYTFTNEEKEQLFGSASAPKRNESIYGYDVHDNPLTRKESLTSWAMRAKKTAAKGKGEKDTDAEFVKTAYDEIMADNTIPWDTKAKFSALVMGTVPSERPMMENCRIEGGSVNEYSKNGELLSKNSFKSIDERNSIIYSLNLKREDQRLSNAYGAAQIKDEKTAQTTLEAVAEANGMTAEQLKTAMDKQPLRRSEEEQNACVALRKAYEDEQFVPGTLHAEQSNTEGKDVVEENGLGTETPNNEAVAEVLGDLTKAEDALQTAMDGNDVLKEEYERMQKAGMSNPQIYMGLFNSGLTQEQLAPLADYINALSKAQGMFKGTQDKIVETTQKHVGQWSYKDELNGEKQNGEQMLFVKDNKGRVLIVGAGDVAFDGEGRVRDGDMLTVYDPATREMDFVHAKDVTLERTASSEEYAKDYQRQLEELNSTVYAEMQSGGDKPSEASLSQTKPGEQNVQSDGEETKHSYSLGEKKAGNGEPFYQDENGNIDLVTIPDEIFEGIGYTKAPFRLTPSMIKHMLDRHNKELGFKDEGEAINFVVDVMNNFDHVRLGYDGALVFSIENGRKRTGKRAVTVLINSDNGEFYGLKTSGYEGIKGLEKRPLLWERGANETSSTDAASASVTTGKSPISGGQSGSASHQGNGLYDKDSNNSANGNGNNETLTFADGTPVPMMKDSKGRETADYSQMTAEQGAEWIEKTFGEDAEAVADGKIERAKKTLSKAEKMKIDMSADDADVLEAKAKKKTAIETAKNELELYTNIKKAMTEKKVKAGMEKVSEVGEVGSVGVAREKFENGLRVVGNKRTRTLADGTKIKGHYEIVEADSLTPSHNANDGYKKSEGSPVNEEGRTINDRDYENDKQAQLVTDMIAMKYDGQAVDQVPVVTSDGIVVDGNGRTMAGQKAAKDGTDGAYLEALKENAENYGFTAEQIEQSGIKHPRLVLVSDEPMKYDTATFAKFNKNEKKAQGNTQQAVANSKKLSTDEIGTIISEIEGSGSLDAFFNNPSAINSLLTRLVDKGVIGLNEVAGLREGEDKLSAAGKDFVKNLLLGSVFSENTIRMMGADAMLKTKALNGIRAVTDNMKLGDYALMKEIDQAVQLLYEARQGGSGVDAYLRTPAMFGENAADRFDPISQAIALALEGKAEDFRELMMAYNRNAAPYADASQTEMFGERPTKEDFVNEFLKLRNWKNYETRHSSKEGNGDAGSSEGTEPQARGGSVITSEADYDKAVEHLKEAKGEERERILDQMGEYVKEFAKSNGYDEPVVLRTKQDLADAAKTENDKTIIENMSEGAHYPGYYEDGKIHIYLEGSTGSEELRETFEHESVHADNDTDPSRVESLVYSITDMNTLTRRDLESVIEKLVHDTHYTDEARKLPEDEALHMLADEALAHLVEYAQKNGIRAISEITNNPTLLNVAEKAFKERENDRRRKEGLAKSGDKTLERKNLDDVSTEENGRALEGDKEGKPENDNGGSHDRDIQAGEEQREVDKTQRTNTIRDPLVETTKAAFEQSKAEYLKALKEGKTGKELENAELHYKFSFLDYQNVMGVTDAESLEKLWKREFESAKTSETEPSEASLGLPKPLGEKGAAEQEGVEPSKTNTLAWLAHTAEMYKDEQVQKAKEELTKAKESGDASDIKRATEELKGLMDAKLRGNGIGLVERRRIIGREIGKILGKEAGKAEAEKIDKPWADMEFDEQVAETEKKPLDADEIKNSDCDGVDKANAVAYLNGDKNIINTLSYLTVYDNVRNRERDSVPSSGTEDGTQLDAADNAGGEGLGRTDSRPQGVDSGQLGGSEGDGNPERGESVQSGERVSGGESGKVHATTAVGERGGEQVHGGASRVEPVSTGGTKPRGSRGVRGTGRDVRERGNEGSGNFSDEKAGEATGGRGIDSRNLSTVEQIDKEISDTQSLVDDLFNSLFDGRTKGSIISDRTNASIIPLASDHLLGKLGINKQKMAVYKQLIPALTKLGYLHIKKGVVKLNDWIDAMKGSFGGHLTKLGLSDEEVYDYIKNMWNSNIEVDGVTHKLSEWASILGTERMKKEIATPNAEKYKRQVAAEPIKVKVGDIKNIEETLPYLLPQQQEDVLRAETQFFGNEHADREHAYGKGYMFTNGTGTGKTFTGLGIAKRLVKQGKGRILIVTPSQKKVSDWIKDGHNLNMEIRDLDNWAKERGTTATTESGEGVVITTFANFGVNKKLLETKWDAVIYDESHRIMENKNGTETARSMQHYMVTNRSENHCFLRLQETNKDYQKMKSLGERFDAERDKEVKRIQDEYKASHPSATPRDVAYATSRMLPKERNGFTPGDYASFPKLGKIHAEFVKALSHYTNEVKPKLEAQAKAEWKDTKTIFLSATPFNTRENLDYAEGYIFKYPEEEKGGRMSGRTQFYLDHFGAAYKFRYGRLEQSTSNPEAVAKQEIAFSDYLQDTLGTMSGRIIDSPYDYSRDFPTVSPDHAETFNQAVQEAVRGHEVLAKAYNQTIGDYNYGSALFETMKVANIIERIKAHLDAGRKVVIFHRRVETKEPLKPPFASMLEQANRSIALMKPGEEQKKAIQAVKDFRKKYADLLEWEQTLDYSMPREQIAKVFGKDKVLFFSGKESTKVKDKAVDTFNSDDSGKNIIVIQEASGKEGISLHDKTGKHQRVCITLALPQSPITALQIEGRTYRIGNKSNAIFEYPILGLNSEMMLFGEKFNNQVSTTENLALGSQARNLRDSFANGILEHSGVVPIDQQGVGGKEFDAPKEQSTDGFDNAVLDYYSNQKLNSRNREGVDYFPTPEPLGYKMMEWANMGEGDTVLEPSAGHGAIARYAPKGNQMVAIEPSQSLFTKLQLKAGGLGRKFQNTIFENYDIGNKHDVVVMNPPFGTAGATAIAHLGKAFKHLEEGGRVVALIPRGSTDKKFEKWIEGEKTAVMRAEVELPDIVFKQAGTNVVCRVVVVDKISNEAMRAKAGSVEKWNLGGHYDKIEDFFEDLRDVEMPDRIIDTKEIMMKKSKQTVKDLKELKDVTVNLNEHGINVRVRGDRNDYSIMFDLGEYNAEQRKSILSGTYERFEEYERYTRDETSQAVIAELKKLSCKLAGMTEEEMQRYLKKKYEGKGVMENIAHSAEVYNNAKKLRFQKAPKEEQSEELYLSLQNKKGKEYYDTVDILSERIADGRADIRGLSERPGRKETNRISAGIEIIAASRDKQNEAGTAKSNETKLRLGRVATEKAIEEWAKSNDAVFAEEDIAKGAMDGKPSAEGGEAVVYVSDNFSKVTKLVDPYPRNNGSIQLCMENTRLFNRLFPDAAYTVKGVARDKNGKFRIVMEQPYLEGKQYGEDTMAEYENGPSQAKDALMESLGLHDVYGDGLEFRNDKYYVSDLHPGNIVFDSEGQPHVIDADVKYYGVFRRNNIEGKPLIVDNEAKEPKTDARSSEEFFKSLKDKEGKEYYDAVTELAERMAGRTGRKEESVSEGQSQPRETSVGRNTERIVGRPKSVVHCAAEIIATDTERSYGNGGLQQSERGLERGEKNALVPREKSSQSEVSTAGVWENRVSDPVEREISKRIEAWAKQTNHWFDWRNLRTKYDRTKQLGDGTEAESDVFLSKDGKTVLKVVRNPHALYTSLLGKLNSIALHNKLFGDVGQTIIGITRTTETDALGKDVSTIGLLIEQPFVEGKPVADVFNNYGEEIAYIDKTMTDLGFKPEKWADNGGYFNGEPETVWRKDDVIVYDTHGNNIFIDKNGKPRLIDCGIETYKDYAKRHTLYDSAKAREAEYENAVRAVKSEIRALEKEVLNEERLIAMLRDNRREDNADKIDGFINHHEEKIAELKHKIRINAQALQKPNSVHYRTEPTEPLADGASAHTVSERIIKTVEKAAEKTGGKVKMVNTVEEIGNEQVRRDIENGKQVTGWYDEKTGEVHLYMPNIHDTYTAEKTVWHETVGHKGMRGLLGDKFNDYMRGLWLDLDNPVNAELRAYVKERMSKDAMGFYDAIEEFIAESAEKGKGEPWFWNNIKNKVTDALHEIGYRISPNVKDVKYMLWLAKNVQKNGNDPWWKMRADAVKWKIEHENVSSIIEENGMMYDNNGKKHGLLDLNKKDFDEATDGRVHYRTSPMTASKIEEYNRRLSTKWYAFKESTVDDMQSLQEAMQIISGVKDAYTDIPSAFNPLQCHNRMGSMVMQMCERYDREYTEPLGDAFKKVVSAMPGKDGAEQMRNANLYFIKKHGLERNRVLFVRDKIREERRVKGEESNSIDALESAWNGEKNDLGQKLRSGQIDLREYYRQMDEWIVQNIDKDFKAEEHDYSGMHGIYDVKKGEEYDDANVIDEVMSTESQLGADLVKSFWDAKKKATDFTIDQEYANGKKDRAERDHLKEMFDWYVPLRKFDDTVAEDVYGYISGGDTKNYIGSVIEKASGRESLSDVNVLAQISALAKSSIINGGKNVEKQHFMRFVEAYEKGDTKDRIFVEIQPWVEKHIVDGNEVWEEVMPNIPENSTQEQINEILNTFETTMKAKQAKGEAKIARRKSDIGYKFERSSDMNQHIVNVYVNGRVRRFVCQGNPRAAQAINGLLRDSGTRNWATEKSAKLNRICAQLNTSLNPDFISSNLMRDLTFASANLTKEGMGYTWDFCMEYAKNWGSMVRRKDGNFDGGYLGMFRRYKEGRLDTNNQKERLFKEFMDNGGETGFVSLKKYEDIIKEYENLVKTGNKDGDRWLMKKLKEGGALVELANEVVENVARYSTYCVSRKRGRSIGKSIYDAKEVSSNFNRHGSGDAVKSLKTEYDGKTNTAFRKSVGWFNSYMKNQTMFYNAGVQGANLFAKNIKHAPKTAAIAFGAMPFGLNIAVALLNQLLISQEDEKKRNGVKNPYAELPEWKRRNNLCIYWGGGKFKTIPMGIELRAFYGLGDIAAGYMVDESLKSDTPIGFDVIGQMAQLVPASDFLGHHSPSSGIKESLEDVALSLTPTVAKPELELAFNRNWTGRPIYRDKDYLDRAPRWKSAYDNTNDVYMTINKWANKTFNGIDDTNEDLKGSGMMADAADFFTAPYGLQHIVEGYTGGTGATIGRTYQTGKSLVNGVVSGIKDDKDFKEGFKKEWKNVDPNSIPFYRVFNYTPKEGNDMQRTKSKWYNYVNELEQLKYNKRQLKTNTSDVVMNIHNAATKYKLSKTKEGKMLKIYEAADKYITTKNKLLKRAKDQTVINSINEDINRKMQEAVADLDRISDD